MNLLREYVRGLLNEATQYDSKFLTLMDAGYDGIKEAMFLADSLGIPSQELPWINSSISDYLYYEAESMGIDLNDPGAKGVYTKLLANTGWTWEEWVSAGTADYEAYERDLGLRECVRRILSEKDDSAGPGERYIYRGMKIDIGSAGLASQIRKIAQKKSAGISEREAGSFIMGQLKNEEIGESWTTNRDVASSFADVWEATNRGSTLHVMFTGKIPNEFGYDPTTTGEEPPMFEDESEVRIPKGEEIFISNVAVFIADKKGGKNWMKFKPVAFSLGSVRA